MAMSEDQRVLLVERTASPLEKSFVRATGEFCSLPVGDRPGDGRSQLHGSLTMASVTRRWSDGPAIEGRTSSPLIAGRTSSPLLASRTSSPLTAHPAETGAWRGRALREDHSWRTQLHSSSLAEAKSRQRLQSDFQKTLRLVDTSSTSESWQQKTYPPNGLKISLSGRTHRECHPPALAGDVYNNHSMDCLGVSPMWKRQQCGFYCYAKESQTTSFQSLPPASISSAASTALPTSFQHLPVPCGHHLEKRPVHRVNQDACVKSVSSPQQDGLAVRHFDMAVDDVDELEEDFFPERRPVIDCGNR